MFTQCLLNDAWVNGWTEQTRCQRSPREWPLSEPGKEPLGWSQEKSWQARPMTTSFDILHPPWLFSVGFLYGIVFFQQAIGHAEKAEMHKEVHCVCGGEDSQIPFRSKVLRKRLATLKYIIRTIDRGIGMNGRGAPSRLECKALCSQGPAYSSNSIPQQSNLIQLSPWIIPCSLSLRETPASAHPITS